MADTQKVLAQSNPSATTLTDIYTVPASTGTVANTLVVANRSAIPATFRIAVAIAGAADNPKQYLYYDIAIEGNDTFTATIGITLAASDVIRVYAANATLSFTIFGIEITA
jgi:hypothetical protein